MKKIGLTIVIFLVLAIIIMTSLTSALPSCLDQGITGDTNNDGRLDLTDGIRVLNYLFKGGIAPECLELADFNEDGSINIADVIKLFNFLFQGGQGPINYYFEGINDPLQLGFNWPIDITDLKEEDYEIPEIKAQIPTTVFVGDISGERDIKKCSITALELDSNREPIGEPKLIFDSQWHLENSEFKDLSREPLAFVLEQPEITVGNTYEISVTCIDNKDQSDTIKMLLTPIVPASPPFCAFPDTCCVCVEGTGCDIDPDASPRCLGAEDRDRDLIPETPRPCNEIGGPDDFPAYRGAWIENQAACTTQNQQEGEGGGGTESTTDPPAPPIMFCEVKGLTILKTGDPIPSDIPLPPDYTKMTTPLSNSHTIIQLGHNEGWINIDPNNAGIPAIVYKYGYAFIVLAHLTDGSRPSDCYEGEVIQVEYIKMFYDPTTGRLSPLRSTISIPNLMYSRDNILKFKTIKGLRLPSTYGIELYLKETEELGDGCPFKSDGSGMWCADDYIDERGGPGDKYNEWTYFFKTYKKNTIPPKILWYDNPGDYKGIDHIVNARLGYPWTRDTGNIKLESMKTDILSVIVIVENLVSTHRFYCEMRNLVFDNQPDRATNNQKIQVTEPTCTCVEQEWHGQWDNKGDPKECGIGPKSFIQSV